ncbi:MAG: molecular chaperone TorD family protein [Alphaproteobacteria bacterium]|nr:molecular chaperone TorD family protein [Alphaproteobacteria bacterium]
MTANAQQMDQTAECPPGAVSPEDRLRADLYNFLGAILAGPPDEMLLAQTAGLTGDDSDLGQAIDAAARVAKISTPATVEREFNALFIGLSRGELLPYASYYLTGFLNEKPLAVLRNDMAARGLARADNKFEPEDNIASLMEMMAALIVGRFGVPASLDEQKDFFDTHIGPWASHFFSDLEGAKNSILYAPVGAIGKAFMEIEQEGFRMAAG